MILTDVVTASEAALGRIGILKPPRPSVHASESVAAGSGKTR
jgi:hypothetical protein